MLVVFVALVVMVLAVVANKLLSVVEMEVVKVIAMNVVLDVVVILIVGMVDVVDVMDVVLIHHRYPHHRHLILVKVISHTTNRMVLPLLLKQVQIVALLIIYELYHQ